MSNESRIRVLVLHASYTDQLSYYDDWRDALKAYSGFDAVEFNILKSSRGLRRHIGEVDAIVALHSTNGDSTAYLERHVAALANRRVPLISFVGNEVNLPGSPMASKRRLLGDIRPQWIATQLLPEAGRYLFGDLASVGVVSIPHALNAAVFRQLGDQISRPIYIGSRVARYAPHLGDDDRNRIAYRFIEIGQQQKFTTDISHRRFDRTGWANFLNRCTGTVSSEAGSWFLERDDATVDAIREYLHKCVGGAHISTDSALLRIAPRLPRWLRLAARRILGAARVQFEHDVYAQPEVYQKIHKQFFSDRPRPTIYGKCISSRHFDAIGTKTCQIMFPGRYNDILEADRHYLALDQDFSNLDDVLDRFADEGVRAAITESAHAHVLAGHTYEHRMRQIENLLRRSY